MAESKGAFQKSSQKEKPEDTQKNDDVFVVIVKTGHTDKSRCGGAGERCCTETYQVRAICTSLESAGSQADILHEEYDGSPHCIYVKKIAVNTCEKSIYDEKDAIDIRIYDD